MVMDMFTFKADLVIWGSIISAASVEWIAKIIEKILGM
jgi:hypothetical protein